MSSLCPRGTFSGIGQAECVVCPAGSACPSTTGDDTISCSPGTYSLQMSTQCTPCPAGSYCTNTSSMPLVCATGFYSREYSVMCTPCPPGHHCPMPSELPIECEMGTYSPGMLEVCLQCTSGYSCPPGSSAPSSFGTICSLGYYCPDGAMELACPAATYGSAIGLTNALECTPCPPGFFCPAATAGYPRAELKCPAGHYCPQLTTTQFEFPCADGTYSITSGLHREDQCLVCPSGRFCMGGDSIGGQICTSGHFCPQHSGRPTPCPAGTYTVSDGADDLSSCELCPAGYFCPEGSPFPLHCPAGTFNPLIGQGSLNNCQACIAGLACTTIALTQPNEQCAAGYFCPRASSKSADPMNECPPGTFTDYHNLTDSRECSICPAGEACLSGTGGVQQPRLQCAPGHFCPNRTEFPTQYPCSPGSFSNRSNLQRQENCEVCPPSYYCLGGGAIPSGLCRPGHYCMAGMYMAYVHTYL